MIDTNSVGAVRIGVERVRQITDEGHTPEGDRGKAAELFAASTRYADLAALQVQLLGSSSNNMVAADKIGVSFGWPWQAGYWKPSADPVRNAEKAGALLAAGIDALILERTQEGNTGNGTQ